jgi:hypothetical protein
MTNNRPKRERIPKIMLEKMKGSNGEDKTPGNATTQILFVLYLNFYQLEEYTYV